MAKYIGKRVFYMIITLFLIAVLTFVLMKILPGSPFDTERFEKLTPQQQQEALQADTEAADNLVEEAEAGAKDAVQQTTQELKLM